MCEGIERRMTPFSVGFRLTTLFGASSQPPGEAEIHSPEQPDLRIRFSRADNSESERKQPPDNIFLLSRAELFRPKLSLLDKKY
jgi:hypothetical protein